MDDALVDSLMAKIPEAWRERWCGGERGACACLGCVQIGNRLVMAEEVIGRPYIGDPERIDEGRIPADVWRRLKITRADWDSWCARQCSKDPKNG